MRLALSASLSRGFVAANSVRLALTLACIALGVALAGAVHTVHTSALAEVDRAARALSGAADLEIRGPRSGFDDALFAIVASRPEVAAAAPIVETLATVAGSDTPLRVLGIDPFRSIRLQPAFVANAAATGSGRANEILDPDAIWLTPAALALLRVGPGDRISLLAGSTPRAFPVAGALAGLDDAGALAVMDIAAAQWHFDRVGRLSRIELRLRPDVDVAKAREALQPLLPPGVVLSQAASFPGRAAAISRAYRVNLDALALVALATGAFLVFSTLALQAARRRQEFALLRALGVTRRELTALLVMEGAVIGAAGAALGTVLGLVGSRALLRRTGADLGAGFFESQGSVFAPDPWGLAFIALLGIGVAVAGATWVARAVARMAVADALRDRALDLPLLQARHGRIAALLFLAGVPLVFVPPIRGLPLGGYAAIALWLCASVAAVTPLCRAVLGRIHSLRAVPSLAVAQVRQLPGHLAASAAGIVVSASLCVAMAIMVFSFRESFERWLHGVVGADVYVRSAAHAYAGSFTLEQQRRAAALPGVAIVEPLHYDRLVLADAATPLTLVARPIDARILAGFQATPPGLPARGAEIPVWVTEAARDLHGWKAGDSVELPIAGRRVGVRVAGVVRDYARTWGAVLFPIEDYRRLTGNSSAHDLAMYVRGQPTPELLASIRAALGGSPGIVMEDAAELKRKSLRLFDRTFAVTYALEAIAIVIALAGVTSSFAALAWSRRREFGVLRFLGLRRRDVLAMLALEGAATGALGALIGLVSGAAISLVLVHVVNRQSFHWGMEVHWPVGALAALTVSIVVACALGARWSGAAAVRREAILAVKDDA